MSWQTTSPAERPPVDYSFEFFPPRTPKAEARLREALERFAPEEPTFVSVTYGAGGSTRGETFDTILRIKNETPLTPAAHLTCCGQDRGTIDDLARAYWDAGIRRIVALRGDLPQGTESYAPVSNGYAYASDLVAGLKRIADFDISVAAYPECHPDSPSPAQDLDNLKRKLDAGAERAITQFFFEPECFLRFRDQAERAGIEAEIVPGIMPVNSLSKVQRFAGMCGATVPDWLVELFDGLEEGEAAYVQLAAATTADLCLRLQEEGVRTFHFYTLNQADPTRAVCRMMRSLPQWSGPPAEAGQLLKEQLHA